MRRTNFLKTLEFKTPKHLIFDLFGCPLSGMTPESLKSLCDFLGFDGDVHQQIEKVVTYYDVDTRGVGQIFVPPKSKVQHLSANSYIDEWGIGRNYTRLYWEITSNPLKDASLEELKRFEFPDPDSIPQKEFDDLKSQVKNLYDNTNYIICASHPVYGIFELACWMCGFDDFLYRMAAEPEFVHCFFERILDYQKKVSERYYSAIGEYIHYTSSGDDFGTQASTFVSKNMFDELIAPYLKERISFTKKFTKAKFLHHSCGNIETLIPSLIDCGVDILNPVQPVSDSMKPSYLKDKYKGKITFHGGYDTQKALPKNTPLQIKEEVKAFADNVRRDGGFILAAAHNIQSDVPVENINAFLQAMKEYK